MTRVGFDQRMYRVHEDEEYIAPILTLDKPAKCCIIVRAVLQNATAEGEFVPCCYIYLIFDWASKMDQVNTKCTQIIKWYL